LQSVSTDWRFRLPDPETEIVRVRTLKEKNKRKRKRRIGKEGERRGKGWSIKKSRNVD
jgi:hypothetical protein